MQLPRAARRTSGQNQLPPPARTGPRSTAGTAETSRAYVLHSVRGEVSTIIPEGVKTPWQTPSKPSHPSEERPDQSANTTRWRRGLKTWRHGGVTGPGFKPQQAALTAWRSPWKPRTRRGTAGLSAWTSGWTPTGIGRRGPGLLGPLGPRSLVSRGCVAAD